MKKKLVTLVVSGVLLSSFLWNVSLNAQEKKLPPEKLKGAEIAYQIVMVSDVQGVRPTAIKAKKGTTLIWLNNGYSPLSITFKGDQRVYVACKEPVNFVVGPDGSFVSTWIPNGATASLCFIEEGTYKYEASFSFPGEPGTNRNTTGTVRVE